MTKDSQILTEKKVIIFSKGSFLNLFFMLLFSLSGFDVRYFSLSSRLNSHIRFLKRFKITVIDFAQCESFSPSMFDGDINHLISNALSNIIPDLTFFKSFAPIFPDIECIDKKLYVCLRQLAESQYDLCMRIVAWANGMYPDNKKIYVVIDRSVFSQYYLSCSCVKLINLSLPGVVYFRLFSKIFFRILCVVKNVVKKYFLRFKCKKSSDIFPRLDYDKYKVLFFPHQSIYYGQLFKKDYFYHSSIDSPFFPSNILHLELSANARLPSVQQYLERQRGEGFPTEIIPELGAKEGANGILKFAKHFLIIFPKLRKMQNRPSWIILLYLGIIFVQYNFYYSFLFRYSSAKIALVGYDVLFSNPLSLALDSHSIRTIALQERFLPTYKNSFNFILDTYLCASDFIATKLRSKDNIFIKNIIPVGMIRSDYFFDFGYGTIMQPCTTVVVLDYHTEPHKDVAAINGCITWENQREFYNDILFLAEKYTFLNFVIRGKNSLWKDNPFFNDIVDRISNLDNLTIDTNYENFKVSYEICAGASLVIARHTSLADECFSVGIPVLYHDYSYNVNSIVFDFFGDKFLPFFCFNRGDLTSKIDEIIRFGLKQTPQQQKLRNEVYGSWADGHVRERVYSIVKNMLDD